MTTPDGDEGALRIPIEPELDLHAFAPRDIPGVVADYIDAAAEAGLPLVRLVHGRGIGVQRARVHDVLSSHPLVERHYDDTASHLGATIAVLKRASGTSAGS